MASKGDDGISHLSEENIPDITSLNLNLKLLKPLDEALRCRICYEYFNNCMITKCSHNYCSLCIRKHMTYRAQCPTCFQDASEPELRNNRLVDEILRLYQKLKESLQNSAHPQPQLKTKSYQPVESINIKIKKEPCTSSQPQKAEDLKDLTAIDFGEVSCPVCYKTVPTDRINIHLDSCLKVQEKKSDKKSLPKLVYHLLSDKEIKKKLKQHGLSVTGERQSLIRRHKNFVTLYNANCDSLEPKTVEDLVLEIEHQEIEERVNSAPKQIQVNKKSDITDIERECHTYVKQHQSQFNDLIHDIQQRHLGLKTVKQEIEEEIEDSTECGESISLLQPIQSDYQSDTETEKTIANEEVCPEESIVQESLSSNKIKRLSKSKSTEKIQDTSRNDSSFLDDLEKGKIKLSQLKKRKKERKSTGNPASPKKKEL
ncbi:e3 ubiquitin-protein ligase RAD18 [Trichonephila clavata]|uniref:RING-type E3 ubiquitin transferase n=1 Tax=Trichonephila clavata TaxID=2740835 RepID=A0A8X6H164_TRICU|nr:e3 ubiquitin-protein ligase RAD18 [Trichonephila clavata]